MPYRAFAQAVGLGAIVRKRAGGASVNAVVIENKTDVRLLWPQRQLKFRAHQLRPVGHVLDGGEAMPDATAESSRSRSVSGATRGEGMDVAARLPHAS